MKKILIFAFFSWQIGISLAGQNLSQANASAKKDLEDATSRLSELRKLVEEEKIPLSADIRRLEREAQEKRTEVDRLNRIRDNRDANLIQLKEDVKTGNAEIESIRRILADYTRSWAETMPPAERINLKDMHEEFAKSSNGNRKEEIQSLLNTTKLSAQFIEKQAGGMKFSGNAIVPPEGTREEGLFWSIVFTGIRWALLRWGAESMLWVVVAQALHALTFALFHVCAMQGIHRWFAPAVTGKAHALYNICSFGLSLI